jgi:hypothetical protein
MSVHSGHHPLSWVRRQDWRVLALGALICLVGLAWTARWL